MQGPSITHSAMKEILDSEVVVIYVVLNMYASCKGYCVV
jgi:hypothetical protein